MTRASFALYLSALAVATTAATACTDPLPAVPERTIAYVVLSTQRNAAGDAYVLQPTALFLRSNQLNLLSSANAPDMCVDRPFVPLSTGGPDTLPAATYLNAGDAVALQTTSGGTASLVAKTDAFGKTYYAPGGSTPVAPFSPGEVVTLTVPGGSGTTNVFPAMTLTQTTVTPFTVGDVPTASNAPGGVLRLTWSAPPVPPTGVVETGMLVSLRYTQASDGTEREVYCGLFDDGTFDIPNLTASGWYKSDSTSHQVVFTRWRGELKQISGAYTSVVSTFRVPTPIAP